MLHEFSQKYHRVSLDSVPTRYGKYFLLSFKSHFKPFYFALLNTHDYMICGFYYLHLALFLPAVFFYNTFRADLQPFFCVCRKEVSLYGSFIICCNYFRNSKSNGVRTVLAFWLYSNLLKTLSPQVIMNLTPKRTTRWMNSEQKWGRFVKSVLRCAKCCHGISGSSTTSHVTWSHVL